MQFLKADTATTIRIGPFVDDTDGVTAETGLTISQADVRLSKGGAVAAQKNDATSATHDEAGYYRVPLNSTDTNTEGTLEVCVSESGALPVIARYMVLPAEVYDSVVAGTDKLQVDVVQVDGSAASVAGTIDANVVQISGDSAAADNLESYCDGTTPIPANATQISGDATAANNLESYCDGTTPIPSNVTSISGSTTAADILEAVMLASSTGTASGTVTTTGTTGSSLTGLGDDALNGCVIVFTTGNAAKEPRRITDYTSSSGAMTWTPAMTTAPAATNAFVILGYIEQ